MQNFIIKITAHYFTTDKRKRIKHDVNSVQTVYAETALEAFQFIVYRGLNDLDWYSDSSDEDGEQLPNETIYPTAYELLQ